ncbi:hypothetical protein D3C83_132670 [compost metagenome]
MAHVAVSTGSAPLKTASSTMITSSTVGASFSMRKREGAHVFALRAKRASQKPQAT